MASIGAGREAAPGSERIDAHHHLWRYLPEEFGWLTAEMADLRRDFLVPELQTALSSAGVDRAVAVQARCSLEETEFLLSCARRTSAIAGVVGWVPLAEKNVGTHLETYAQDKRFCGVREIAQGQAEGFFDRSEFNDGIRQLTQLDLAYDILIYASQLAEATKLVDRHPKQRFVLDHAAKPLIACAELEPWSSQLRELARRPNVTCKLSGLVTEAHWKLWTLADLLPYLDTCVEAFTPARVLAGSDWPVCLVACGYERWWDTLEDYFAEFSQIEREAIVGDNAAREYRLSQPNCPSASEPA